jgi:superfamily I DNA and/or RNA helicase
VEKYTRLITDAAVHEIKQYDVILCTCSASVSPRMIRGANVRQLIVDEGGMCMEPECLIPVMNFNTIKQVVIVGDHRQLQPIVLNTVAKDRGLDVSLFERYKERAIMLTHQYRMVGTAILQLYMFRASETQFVFGGKCVHFHALYSGNRTSQSHFPG